MDTRHRERAHRPTRIFTGPINGGEFRADERRRRKRHRAGAQMRSRPTGNGRGRAPRRRPRRKVTPLAIAALVLVGAILARSLLPSSQIPAAQDLLAGEETAHSTPMREWRRGEVPHLYQIDPQWEREPYAGGTIRENGCGPTCLSMVYVALTGRTDYDPVAIARLSESQGHTVDGMTAWTLMSEGAAALGLSSREIPATADSVRAELQAGSPIICSVRPGDFTTTGHFIVLAGLTENSQVIVRDPNSKIRSDQPWDLDRVLGQCANLWAFSA